MDLSLYGFSAKRRTQGKAGDVVVVNLDLAFQSLDVGTRLWIDRKIERTKGRALIGRMQETYLSGLGQFEHSLPVPGIDTKEPSVIGSDCLILDREDQSGVNDWQIRSTASAIGDKYLDGFRQR
jgi:hypothetical protein